VRRPHFPDPGACKQLGIRVVDTRNEAIAVFAADAIARLADGPRSDFRKGSISM
jgi:hypothetical protein